MSTRPIQPMRPVSQQEHDAQQAFKDMGQVKVWLFIITLVLLLNLGLTLYIWDFVHKIVTAAQGI